MFYESAASGKSTTLLLKAIRPKIFEQHKLALMGHEKRHKVGWEGMPWIWEKLREGGGHDQNTLHEHLKDLKCHLKLQHAGTCLIKDH